MMLVALLIPLLLSAADPSSGAVVDSIYVTGAEGFSVDGLLDGSGLEIGSSLMEITPSEVYSAVLSNLTSIGYMDAAVQVQWPEWYEETGIVRVQVQPGRRSLFGALVFTGNSALDTRSLVEVIDVQIGEPVTPEVLAGIRASLLELYASRGYVLASVETQLLPFDESSPESLEATRGIQCTFFENRQIRLGSVSVEGLETIRKSVVTREILLQEGDSLNMEMMRRSISAIYDLGLFSDVRFVYEGLSEGCDSVALKIQVTERSYRQLDLGAGYASPSTMILSAYWKHPNIMGNNQRITIGSSWSRYLSSGGGNIVEPELIYEEPYLASTKWEGRFRLSYLYFSLPGLEERKYGVELSVSRFLSEDLELTLGYSISRNKYYETGAGGAPQEYDWATTSRVGAALDHDTRDAVLDPRTGHLIMTEGGLSGGFLGGRSFYSLLAELRVFKPVIRDAILAWRIRGGVVFPYGADSVIAPGDRYFLGGGTTIRGYGFNAVGPEDADGNPVGGKVMLLGNIETRLHIFGPLGIALFLDSGGLWESIDEVTVNSAGFGIGMGVRITTPFGPLRLDYGFAPTWTDGLRRGRAYLALGHPF